ILDQIWFPGLRGDVSLTGTFLYDPDAFVDGAFTAPPNAITVTLDAYEFGMVPSLGFAVTNDGPGGDEGGFFDSMPTVNTPMPPNWFGEDAVARFFDPTGTALAGSQWPATLDGFSSGELLLFGKGVAFLDGQVFNSRLSWDATIDSIHPVPEPATM